MRRTQAPTDHSARSVRDLIVDPPRPEHRPLLVRPRSLAQSPLDPSLAVPKLQRSTRLHSKSLVFEGTRFGWHLPLYPEKKGFSYFYFSDSASITLDRGLVDYP